MRHVFSATTAQIVTDKKVDLRRINDPFQARVYSVVDDKLIVVKLFVPQPGTYSRRRPVMSTVKTWMYADHEVVVSHWRTQHVQHQKGTPPDKLSERLFFLANRALIEHHGFLHEISE
jgi:hypothetical protein